jgi:hypothetical protein
MSTSTTPARTGARHPVNVAHLVMGLVFLGVAGAWGLGQLGVIDAESSRWLIPGILVLAGGAGIVAAVAKGLSKGKDEPVDQSAGEPAYFFGDDEQQPDDSR